MKAKGGRRCIALLFNFRFSQCILTVSHFYYPTNALNYIKLLLLLLLLLLALQPPLGVVFYSPLAGFSLLAYEVS